MMHSVGITPSPIGPEEEERRLRMAQAVSEEDAVSERLTQRKRRKRKNKKHSSKAGEILSPKYMYMYIHCIYTAWKF